MTATLFFIFILSIPLWGYLILVNRKINPAALGWFLCLAFIGISYFLIQAPPLFLMLLFIAGTFLSQKIVVAHNHLGQTSQLNFKQWLLFCYGWFGMNPRPFLAFPSSALPGSWALWIRGISRMILGLIIINLASLKWFSLPEFIQHLFYLIGISLMLHFGLLNIFAGTLRRFGIPVTTLFKDPLSSKSLNEFWSKRWNLAFVELTTLAVTRPVKSKYGNQTAFWISFIFSGLLHEMAISLPVKSRFGKPMLYFIIQAVLILSIDRFIRIQSSQVFRTILILACLGLPIFLLFHKQFILQIILPLVSYLKIV